MPLSRTLFLLGTQVSAGLVVALLLVRRDEFGSLFDRVIAGTAGAIALLAVLLDPLSRQGLEAGGGTALLAPALIAATGIGALLWALLAHRRWELRWPWLLACGATGLVGIAMDASLHPGAVPLPGAGRVLHPVSTLSAAAILGTGWVTMLGGHWYLVNPDLPIDPLLRLSRVAMASIVARAVVALAALAWWWLFLDPGAADWPTLLEGVSTFLLGRILLGLALPFGAMFLVLGTAKIRSTQSATGILYFVYLFIVAGELLASYVRIRTGIPV